MRLLASPHRSGTRRSGPRRPRLRAFAADRRGVASVEFALWTVLFFMVALVALDFGFYHIQARRADEGVSSAALSAFSSASNVDFAGLTTYVRTLAGDSTLAVTTACNGVAGSCTNTGRSCACLTGTGGYVALACGTTCSGTGMTAGSTAGYYLTVRATRNYTAMVVPRSLINGARISRSATVRLQ